MLRFAEEDGHEREEDGREEDIPRRGGPCAVRANLRRAAVVGLSHAFLPAMLEKGEGAVVNVASTAAFQPAPYGATKAFVLSFSEALWAEYRSRGVRVLALASGPTETAFWDTWSADQPRGTEAFVGTKSAAEVVGAALKALEAGKIYAVPGRRNRLMAQSPRPMPRSLIARLGERLLRPGGRRDAAGEAAVGPRPAGR